MSKNRLLVIYLSIALLWTGMIVRGAYLQLLPNPQLEKIKQKQFKRSVKLGSRRGDILDRNGNELAVSVRTHSLFADPKIIKDPYAAAIRLAKLFKVSFRSIYKKIKNPKKRFEWIKRRLSSDEYKTIKSWKLRGLAFQEEFKRVYPNNDLAASVLGFVGREQQGLSGVEKRYETHLSGAGKKLRVQRDARGRVLVEDGRFFASYPEGSDITLTIDKDLQYWVERQLKKAVEDNQAESAWAVVLDPNTSEILSMGSYPGFNSNSPRSYPVQTHRNRNVNDMYETGSVMKAFTVAGALEQGIVEPNTKIDTEMGRFRIGRRIIKEADKKHSFKELTVTEIITHSSNVGTSKIALQMKDKNLHKVLKDFGFGEKSGVGISAEAPGILHSPPWRDHLAANISFGHGIAVTALQVANAYAAIANGGTLHRPYLIKEIRDLENGRLITTPVEPIRRVISKKNADLVKMMLSTVVADGGSGYRARIDGFPAAGKTGTAQKVNPNGRGYLPGKYISSFAGFIPVNSPKYVIYVAVDSPTKKGYYASTVAAPLFRSIAEFALRRDGATPVYVTDQKMHRQTELDQVHEEKPLIRQNLAHVPKKLKTLRKMPALKGLTLREAMKRLKGYDIDVKIIGSGQKVLGTSSVAQKSTIKEVKVILTE